MNLRFIIFIVFAALVSRAAFAQNQSQPTVDHLVSTKTSKQKAALARCMISKHCG